MDLGTVATAWTVAGIFSKLYFLLCGIAAVVLVATLATSATHPSELLIDVFEWSGTTASVIEDAASWIRTRAEIVAGFATACVYVGLFWSALGIHFGTFDFTAVRGPATAWLGSLVVAEALGRGEAWSVARLLMWTALAVVVLEWLLRRIRRAASGTRRWPEWAATPTVGLILFGLVAIPILPLIAWAHGVGGAQAR